MCQTVSNQISNKIVEHKLNNSVYIWAVHVTAKSYLSINEAF